MKRPVCRIWYAFCTAALVLGFLDQSALAVHTMADWTGQNTVMPTFTSNNPNPLHGVAVEGGAGAGTPWVANNTWRADGATAGGVANAWLPFTPVSGNVYSLSLDVNPTSGGPEWFALAFAESNTTDNFFLNNGTAPSMLFRFDAQTFPHQSFLGPGFAGVQNYAEAGIRSNPSFARLTMKLDTTQPQWTAEWLTNGVSVRQDTFGANPTLNYVGFGSSSPAGFVDNFELTVVGGGTSIYEHQFPGPAANPSPNNYGVISPTSVGGIVESKINFASEVTEGDIPNIDVAHIYLSDPTLDVPGGVLDFTNALHMEGTITFDANGATEPGSFCFCWYNSSDTRHRIGLGLSNLTVAQGGAVEDHLRIDFGYAASGGNRFYFATEDGTADQTNNNSVLPDGTYPFTFDYVPGPEGMAGGTMSVTVGDYFRTISPLETAPWDTDFFQFDRFGIVHRSTANTTQDGTFNVEFSNMTYTGGTNAPAISGDHNNDGKYDSLDYVVWRMDPAASGGDPNGYTAWRAGYGTSSGSGNILDSSIVPEPAVCGLVLVAAMGLVATGQRRGDRRIGR